jgi:hypothetical protein
MDLQPPRVPPRFVPVLTEIVPADEAPAPVRAEAGASGAEAVAVPAFAAGAAAFAASAFAPATARPQARPAASLEGLEDQLIHRVMQRVDVSLEQQLHDAVASMVLQHTHSLVPRLREEIEFVVRQAVAQAIAAELAARQAS